ncbi:MAG: helix-turn-helix domain-containing protein, partial [Propionibacteriaceae bacterium]|nr:helix-turn-helix domain-containing protein [Propionibacteriaceae bacterium]
MAVERVVIGVASTDGDDTRRRVLATIRAAAAPVSVEDLAHELNLHPNTVRFHARALELDGLVAQDRVRTGGKGRPRAVFSPTVLGARSGARNFELLSTVLLEHVVTQSPDPVAAATAAGRSWAAALDSG